MTVTATRSIPSEHEVGSNEWLFLTNGWYLSTCAAWAATHPALDHREAAKASQTDGANHQGGIKRPANATVTRDDTTEVNDAGDDATVVRALDVNFQLLDVTTARKKIPDDPWPKAV